MDGTTAAQSGVFNLAPTHRAQHRVRRSDRSERALHPYLSDDDQDADGRVTLRRMVFGRIGEAWEDAFWDKLQAAVAAFEDILREKMKDSGMKKRLPPGARAPVLERVGVSIGEGRG